MNQLFKDLQNKKKFLNTCLMNDHTVYILSNVFGWIYFVAWSISFYPQIYTNLKRKSVIGLNLDFVALNITGFLTYSIYNVGTYIIYQIIIKSKPPLEINDIVFGVHAFIASTAIGIQSCIYERGNQRITKTTILILVCFAIVILISSIVFLIHSITALSYLLMFSYIKLVITLIKYVPQVYMNYKRKSTVGWNIGGVFLDTIGGIFSLAQSILVGCFDPTKKTQKLENHLIVQSRTIESFNNFTTKSFPYELFRKVDEKNCIINILQTNPSKIALSLFSLSLDAIFYLQHYGLYASNSNTIAHSPLNNNEDSNNINQYDNLCQEDAQPCLNAVNMNFETNSNITQQTIIPIPLPLSTDDSHS